MGLLGVLGSVAGAAVGGPAGSLLGGTLGSAIAGGTGTAITSAVGGATNTALAAAEAGSDIDQTNNLIGNMKFNSQEMWQQTAFNQMTEQQSQQMQEVNSLRDVAMQQRKADDSITKEFISSIKS